MKLMRAIKSTIRHAIAAGRAASAALWMPNAHGDDTMTPAEQIPTDVVCLGQYPVGAPDQEAMAYYHEPIRHDPGSCPLCAALDRIDVLECRVAALREQRNELAAYINEIQPCNGR